MYKSYSGIGRIWTHKPFLTTDFQDQRIYQLCHDTKYATVGCRTTSAVFYSNFCHCHFGFLICSPTNAIDNQHPSHICPVRIRRAQCMWFEHIIRITSNFSLPLPLPTIAHVATSQAEHPELNRDTGRDPAHLPLMIYSTYWEVLLFTCPTLPPNARFF